MQSNSTEKSASSRCTFKRWDVVLHSNENDPNFQSALSHVEQCDVCQSRLEGTAANDTPWWGEAKQSWLECELPETPSDTSRSSIVIEVEPEMPEDSRIEFETVPLSFLEPPSHPELLGRLGRYEIERVVGKGGMGVVLKANDSELNRVVAIKVLAAHLANNASARKRFAREAQAAAAVLHPNVIPIYNVESDGSLPYLVMQYVPGCSLQSKVDRNGSISLAEALRIAKQTAAGLAAAHDQGLVHRDVKPANILLQENVERVLLSDFGLARAVDDASLTRTGVVAGTPHYMSPEQARGDAIDTRSDQFSLGSVMYFMLAGRPPFRANNAMGVLNRICTETHRPIDQVNPDVPNEVVELIERLMSKPAAQRFQSMHQIEAELEHLLAALQSGGLSLSKRKTKPAKTFNAKSQFAAVKKFAAQHRIALAAFATVVIAATTWFALWPRNNGNEMTAGQLRKLEAAKANWNMHIQEDQQFLQDVTRANELARQIAGPLVSNSFSSSDQFEASMKSLQSQIEQYESQFSNSTMGQE